MVHALFAEKSQWVSFLLPLFCAVSAMKEGFLVSSPEGGPGNPDVSTDPAEAVVDEPQTDDGSAVGVAIVGEPGDPRILAAEGEGISAGDGIVPAEDLSGEPDLPEGITLAEQEDFEIVETPEGPKITETDPGTSQKVIKEVESRLEEPWLTAFKSMIEAGKTEWIVRCEDKDEDGKEAWIKLSSKEQDGRRIVSKAIEYQEPPGEGQYRGRYKFEDGEHYYYDSTPGVQEWKKLVDTLKGAQLEGYKNRQSDDSYSFEEPEFGKGYIIDLKTGLSTPYDLQKEEPEKEDTTDDDYDDGDDDLVFGDAGNSGGYQQPIPVMAMAEASASLAPARPELTFAETLTPVAATVEVAAPEAAPTPATPQAIAPNKPTVPAYAEAPKPASVLETPMPSLYAEPAAPMMVGETGLEPTPPPAPESTLATAMDQALADSLQGSSKPKGESIKPIPASVKAPLSEPVAPSAAPDLLTQQIILERTATSGEPIKLVVAEAPGPAEDPLAHQMVVERTLAPAVLPSVEKSAPTVAEIAMTVPETPRALAAEPRPTPDSGGGGGVMALEKPAAAPVEITAPAVKIEATKTATVPALVERPAPVIEIVATAPKVEIAAPKTEVVAPKIEVAAPRVEVIVLAKPEKIAAPKVELSAVAKPEPAKAAETAPAIFETPTIDTLISEESAETVIPDIQMIAAKPKQTSVPARESPAPAIAETGAPKAEVSAPTIELKTATKPEIAAPAKPLEQSNPVVTEIIAPLTAEKTEPAEATPVVAEAPVIEAATEIVTETVAPVMTEQIESVDPEPVMAETPIIVEAPVLETKITTISEASVSVVKAVDTPIPEVAVTVPVETQPVVAEAPVMNAESAAVDIPAKVEESAAQESTVETTPVESLLGVIAPVQVVEVSAPIVHEPLAAPIKEVSDIPVHVEPVVAEVSIINAKPLAEPMATVQAAENVAPSSAAEALAPVIEMSAPDAPPAQTVQAAPVSIFNQPVIVEAIVPEQVVAPVQATSAVTHPAAITTPPPVIIHTESVQTANPATALQEMEITSILETSNLKVKMETPMAPIEDAPISTFDEPLTAEPKVTTHRVAFPEVAKTANPIIPAEVVAPVPAVAPVESQPVIAEAPAISIKPVISSNVKAKSSHRPTLEYGVFTHPPTQNLITNFANDDAGDLDLTIEIEDNPARRARRHPRHEVTRV